MNLDKLLELDRLSKKDGKRYDKKRLGYYERVKREAGKHFIGIVGPRGAGKTVLLKQMACEQENAFYLSVDTLGDVSLFETVKTLSDIYKVKNIFLDEVHFRKGFEGELKQIFDFLDVRVVFTSSIALAMIESAFDLSRRVNLVTMLPFSFREYLWFKNGVDLPRLSLKDIFSSKWSSEHMSYADVFEEYVKGRLYPFTLEEAEPLMLLKNILDKIIQKDIPSVAKLHTDEVQLIAKTAEFIGSSEVDGMNYTSIAKNIGITKYKAEQYVGLLKKSFILNPTFPFGTNVLKEPKILMYLPYRLLFRDYTAAVGSIREDFFVEAMEMAGIETFYLKSTRGEKTPDFLIKNENEEFIIEVGGKGKGRQQFKGITSANQFRFTHSNEAGGNRRPLFLLGYTV